MSLHSSYMYMYLCSGGFPACRHSRTVLGHPVTYCLQDSLYTSPDSPGMSLLSVFQRIPCRHPRMVLGCPSLYIPVTCGPENSLYTSQDRPGMSLRSSYLYSGGFPVDVPGRSWDVLTFQLSVFRRIPYRHPWTVLGCPYVPAICIPEDSL